jgi:hypothetical protein
MDYSNDEDLDEMKYKTEPFFVQLSAYCNEQKKVYGRWELTDNGRSVDVDFNFASEEMYEIYMEMFSENLIGIFEKHINRKRNIKKLFVNEIIEPNKVLSEEELVSPCIVNKYPSGFVLYSEEPGNTIKPAKN